MAWQGNKVITTTLVVTAILVALAFIVYLERNLGDIDKKTPNPKSQTPTKPQYQNPKTHKIGTATILSDNEDEKKVSVPIKDDEDLFDKYPPD
ncbi:hypothetical protein HY605_04700, partial [Candidatus Peregrinibacteria bacterium]|nr:hypothetical protein [Candidatus Peregrinibacteria bacterium]